MSLEKVSPANWLQEAKNSAEWVGLRFVRETTNFRVVRNDKPERNVGFIDEGVMVEVLVDGHFGYAGTADLSPEGMKKALARALETTKAAATQKAFHFTAEQRPKAIGRFESPRTQALDKASLEEITSVLMAGCRKMKTSDKIINRSSLAMIIQTDIDFFSSSGSDARQSFHMVALDLNATAAEGSETQTRSLNGGYARSFQTGAEAFDRTMFEREGERLGREVTELLSAPNCPSGAMDLILMPDQMMLQIHESIGHPLEIDRILGDERNYAGWSFVKPTDFGNLQYGSTLMNVSFDPTRTGEMASYSFDDGGTPASKEFLIQDGVLKRGLGSLESQVRSKLPGVANFRSSSWNRAPIDRMANINLEPGTSTLESMVASVENGVLMTSNRSWSIDDYRNKFQFGCEYGTRIENGKLTHTVKNPNYRGTTVDFWKRLKAVGGPATVETYGTPYCGKGEPNQVIRVGHAAPPCLFSKVEVFGGHS
jgi:predicted Zn-dependent protease